MMIYRIGVSSTRVPQSWRPCIALPISSTKKPLFTIEHKMRSMRYPLYGRPLVNRNAAQTNTVYHPGHDAMGYGMGFARA
jgi:hypothetical protein